MSYWPVLLVIGGLGGLLYLSSKGPFQRDLSKLSVEELRVVALSKGNPGAVTELSERGEQLYPKVTSQETVFYSQFSTAELERMCLEGGDVNACTILQLRRK